MKKLLFLSFLLPFLAKAQLPVTRSPTGVTVEDYRLYPILNFRIPPFADTTEANLSKGLDSLGTVINIRGTPRVYVRQISSGTVKKWGLVGDTTSIFVTQIGTGSPQIPLLYAVNGNLRSVRLVPGVFTTPFMNADSAAGINLDTTGVGGAAYKQWIINQYGPGVGGNIYTIDGKLQTNRIVSGSDTHTLAFDSLFEFFLHDSAGHAMIDVDPLGEFATIGTFNGAGVATSQIVWGTDLLGFTARNGWSVGGGSGGLPAFTLQEQASSVSTWSLYWPKNNAGGTDTLATLSDVRAGSGGGGTTNGVGRDTVQAYTSGATLTQSASTNYIQVNPASVQSALTITSLASGGTWHTSNDIYIVFGGTVTSGNPVITSFTFTAGSGLTIVESVPFSGQANAGDVVHYHKIGTILYRVP